MTAMTGWKGRVGIGVRDGGHLHHPAAVGKPTHRDAAKRPWQRRLGGVRRDDDDAPRWRRGRAELSCGALA
jgi:hypothetical protein